MSVLISQSYFLPAYWADLLLRKPLPEALLVEHVPARQLQHMLLLFKLCTANYAALPSRLRALFGYQAIQNLLGKASTHCSDLLLQLQHLLVAHGVHVNI